MLTLFKVNAEKYALIVALSHFSNPDFHTLHCTNDVPFVQASLEKQGFKKENIVVLTDSLATKAAVVGAINTLTEKCKLGDIVWIHITTHGQLLQDFYGYAADGYAKALVMYDSPHKYEPGYKGERHLKDMDIKSCAEKIRTKLGPKGELALTIDACHSGALMRGIAEVKGDANPVEEPGYDPLKKETGKGIEGFYTTLVETKEQESSRAPYVFFSACRSGEVCRETTEKTTNKLVGPLSLALSHVLCNAPAGCTFRELFSLIVSEMSTTVPHQTPVATGNALDKVILGGEIKPRIYTYPIKSVSGDTIDVGVGTFAGVFCNTVFAVYKKEDIKHEHIYRQGTVISVQPFSATVVLEKSPNLIDSGRMPKLEAIVIKKSFGDQSLRVYIDETAGATEAGWLRDILKSCPYVKLVDSCRLCDLTLKTMGHNSVQVIYAGDGVQIADATVDFDKLEAPLLTSALSKFAQGNAIKKLKLDNPFIYTENEIFTVGKDSAERQGGIVTAHAGKDKVTIKVTNAGSTILYINILDIEPSGKVNPIFPQREMDQSYYRIYPTRTFTQTFDVSPPYGMESIKIILSEEDVNLGVLAATQGTRSITNNPLEMLFKDIYGTGTRGVNSDNYKMDKASTVDLTFKIEP